MPPVRVERLLKGGTMSRDIKLTHEDPTVFAKCPNCGRTGKGVKAGRYYGRAFTVHRWKRRPKCENCKAVLVKLFEVKAR